MSKVSLDLSGPWEFKQGPLDNGQAGKLSRNGWMPTKVPASVFGNLIDAGHMDRTDIDSNPENYTWVSQCRWEYRKTFDISADLLAADRIDLVFDGLDTIAQINLNGKPAGNADNMFIPHRFDVTSLVKDSNNELLVEFAAAGEYAKKLIKKHGNKAVGAERVFIRKAQYQFGWDWCPALAGCGIWRPVRLEGIRKARIDNVHIRTVDLKPEWADVEIAVELDTIAKEDFLCKITLPNQGGTIEKDVEVARGKNSNSILIRVDNPQLWWPAGYGQQNLYQLDVKLISEGRIVDQKQESFGIRTVKLNRQPDDYGEKFQFEVNNQPVYVRGANWVPVSMFPGSDESVNYEKFLTSAVHANMNMVRVWGGGYFESKGFYQFCDKLGLMVWQDFMFACAYYPDDRWFCQQIETEAAAIIKQLRNHPSISLWCGNNEIDWIHYKQWFCKSEKFYGKAIYHEILPRLVSQLDPDRNYIQSTPVASSESKDPNEPTSGAVHQWNVWNMNGPVRDYIMSEDDIPRFVTEFGLQSLPALETIKEFCPPTQLRIGSKSLDKHDYQEQNSRIYRYVGDTFGSPSDIEQFVYLSQLTQARAIKGFVEHLRAHNSRNSGAMFWQLNDACSAVSWAAIDNRHRPKALYYYARRFFSNVLITAVPDQENLKPGSKEDMKLTSLVVVNDSSEVVKGAVLKCCLLDMFGTKLQQEEFPLTIEAFSRSKLIPLPKEMVSACVPEKIVLSLALEKDDVAIAENLLLLTADKHIDFPQPKITSKLTNAGENKWKLTLRADTFVKDLHISLSQEAKLSDNFFDLLPSRDYGIDIETKAGDILDERSIKFNFVRTTR